jgi:hypothetical protein
MQAGHDQHAVQHAVDELAEGVGGEHRVARRVHAALEHRESVPEAQREHDAGEAAGDRHEAATGKEREIARQAHVAVAVVEPARQQTVDQSGRHAQLRQLFRAVSGRREIDRAV